MGRVSNLFELRTILILFSDNFLGVWKKRMGTTEIDALTKRIEALEAKVGRSQSQQQQPVLPYLVDYSDDLGNSLAGNDRIDPLLKRLDELETYLDPLYGEKEACSLGVKMSLVESQFNAVKENQEHLERLEKLKPSLEVGKINKMDELQPKISELSQIQLEQREEGERMTEETLELVQRYNDIIASLSEAFITADQVVSKAEEELNIK